MSLTLAHQIARGSLAAHGAVASVVSRNIAGADNPNASAKSAAIATALPGGVAVLGIETAVDTELLERAMQSAASAAELEATKAALDRLHGEIADPTTGRGPAAKLGALRNALQVAASAPHSETSLQSALSAAQDMAAALNDGAAVVARLRAETDVGLAEGAGRLVTLLGDFHEVNRAIVAGSGRRLDVTDAIDRRNGLLREIAGLVDVRTSLRGNDDMVLFLANGTTLFETVPREIAIDATAGAPPGRPGATLRIDGWPFGRGDGLGGRLGGLLEVRDGLSVTFGRQLDEMARGLIAATAESDQSAVPSAPALPGLFTFAGAAAVPPAGTLVDGLAAAIRVNPNADPQSGGAVARLRDGGISIPGDPAYTYNAAGDAGYSERLIELIGNLGAAQPFDPAAGIAADSDGLTDFAAGSVGWLEGQRAVHQGRLDDSRALASHALQTWQNRVGISIDDQMTSLIALERSYQATSRLIGTVGTMFDTLLAATG